MSGHLVGREDIVEAQPLVPNRLYSSFPTCSGGRENNTALYVIY